MGWKTSAILIDGIYDGPTTELLAKLGLGNRIAAGTVTVEEAFYPEGLFVGTHKGSTVIFEDEIPFHVMEGRAEELVARLTETFPGKSFAAVVLHSATNLYGLAYYENGERLRIISGSADDGIYNDEGAPLPAEIRALEGKTETTKSDGTLVYVDQMGEEWLHDHLGEERVFHLMYELLHLGDDGEDFEDWFIDSEVTQYKG